MLKVYTLLLDDMESIEALLQAQRDRIKELGGPGSNCRGRAEALLGQLSTRQAELVVIEPAPRQDGIETKLKWRSIEWVKHIVCVQTDVEPPLFHDPLLRESPQPQEAYLQEMFPGQEVVIKPYQSSH